jgi:aspartyl protease family protein
LTGATVGRRAGRALLAIAWIAGLFLATRYFAGREEHEVNPNTEVSSAHGQGYIEVQLAGNRQGHFIASGQINSLPVQFMLDTGATDVAIPAQVASQLTLQRGLPVRISTANGRSEGYRTQLDELKLGDIVLRDVRAVVAPGLDGDQVLLGMSALRQLEFTQRGGNMLLRQTTP